MFEKQGESMDIKISQELFKAAVGAAAKLEQQETITLEKPFEGFYATFKAPEEEDAKKVFQVFSTAELGMEGEVRKLYLVCENLFGSET